MRQPATFRFGRAPGAGILCPCARFCSCFWPPLADDFAGPLASASDPATSCAANPQRITFRAQPPHPFLTWDHAFTDADGRQVQARRHDPEAQADRMLTLRQAGGARLADGSRPT